MSLSLYTNELPFISTDQMRAVDRLMVGEYKISLFQMMEHAGRNVAALARTHFLSGDALDKHILVLAGTGGNAGGGLVAARHLHNWGAEVAVVLVTEKENLAEVPRQQLSILEKLDIPILTASAYETTEHRSDLIIDALIGYGLSGDPREAFATVITFANESGLPILSLDTPSGLDTTTGVPHCPTIESAATMTLAMPKIGFKNTDAQKYVGALYLADIGVPPALYEKHLDVVVPRDVFSSHTVVKIPVPSA